MRSSRIRWAVLGATALVLAAGLALLRSFAEVRDQSARGLRFFADVHVWHPDDRVERVSPGDGVYYQPCIRPDGAQVIFAGASEGPPRIWCVDLDSGARRALTPPDSAALQPTYSWDGARIAFTSDRAGGAAPTPVTDLMRSGKPRSPGRFHLFVMDADGANVRQVTSGERADWRPSFSPDGARLVYFSTDGAQRLWTVAVDGPGEPEPVQGSDWTARPWFSADGETIFCHTVGPQPHRAHRVPAGGGELVQLENDVFKKTHGSFADPGGELLLVHAIEREVMGIWELPLDGGSPRPLRPPGFPRATHATRSRDGVLAFDVTRDVEPWREALRRLRP